MNHNFLVATRYNQEFWNDKARIISSNRRRINRSGQMSGFTSLSPTVSTDIYFPQQKFLFLIWCGLKDQTLMSRIFCFSNSSMVSSSCLVVRVASMVALWSSLSACWQNKGKHKKCYKTWPNTSYGWGFWEKHQCFTPNLKIQQHPPVLVDLIN